MAVARKEFVYQSHSEESTDLFDSLVRSSEVVRRSKMLIALRETLSNNPDTASSDRSTLNLAKKKLAIHLMDNVIYRVDIGRKITLRDVHGVGSSRKRECASSEISCRARHLRLPCYKLDIGLALVKSGSPGTDSPRGRTRLRLVGYDHSDCPYPINHLSLRQRPISITNNKRKYLPNKAL